MALLERTRKEFVERKRRRVGGAGAAGASRFGSGSSTTTNPVTRQEEFEVEDVVDARERGTSILYRVRWRGWSSKNDTWEPFINLFENSIFRRFYEIRWVGEPTSETCGRSYYQAFRKLHEEYRIGDAVALSSGANKPLGLAIIQELWEDRRGQWLKGRWFYRPTDIDPKKLASSLPPRGPGAGAGGGGAITSSPSPTSSTTSSATPSSSTAPPAPAVRLHDREVLWSTHSDANEMSSLEFCKAYVFTHPDYRLLLAHAAAKRHAAKQRRKKKKEEDEDQDEEEDIDPEEAYFYRFGHDPYRNTYFPLQFDSNGGLIEPTLPEAPPSPPSSPSPPNTPAAAPAPASASAVKATATAPAPSTPKETPSSPVVAKSPAPAPASPSTSGGLRTSTEGGAQSPPPPASTASGVPSRRKRLIVEDEE